MSKKPNIVFILSDDHGSWAMNCAGNKELITPNIDKIASSGIRFENFFCTSPVCSPARMSIMTGKIPSQHGVHDWLAKGHLNYDDLSDELKENFKKENPPQMYQWPKDQLDDDKAMYFLDGQQTYTQVLADNGYVCGLSGKWHMGGANTPQQGFTYWKSIAMGGDNYMTPTVCENGQGKILHGKYLSDYISENAVDFIDEYKDSDKPFYLSVHYTAPHAPWGKEQHPKEIYEMYDDCKFESVPNMPMHEWSNIKFKNDEDFKKYRRESLQGYFTAITAMDRGIGQILDKLEKENLLQDTIIIFTGDNGMSMGHHGLFGKGNGSIPMNMYDSAVKIPFLISHKGHIQANKVCVEMFSHYDIFQTLMDYLNIDVQYKENLPGTSFAPVLSGGEVHGRDSVVVYDEYGPVRMIRTNEWKFVHRVGEFEGMDELYNLKDDPNETNNLVNLKETQKIKQELFEQMNKWYSKYTIDKFDGTKYPVRGSGQLDFCYKNSKENVVFK